MTAIAFVTQTVDERDPVLGVVPGMIRALAERLHSLSVIANAVGSPRAVLPSNVVLSSLGKEAGSGRLARGMRYQRLLVREARAGRIDVLLAHMCPEYLTLAAPVAKVFGFPTMLWYAHPARTRALSLANGLADAVLTSLPGAFPLPSLKIRTIGQATDVRALRPCAWRGPHRPLRVVAIGRTSPAKGLGTIIRAVATCREAGLPVVLRIVGPSTTPQELRHRTELGRLIADSGLQRAVEIEAPVTGDGVRQAMCASDVLVSAMVAGSGDKVVFEAASVGRPVLVSNPAFGGLLRELPVEMTFPQGDARALADRLQAISVASPGAIREATRMLRERVAADHSLDHWADQVVEVAGGLARRGARR